MKILLNIIWMIFGGLAIAIEYIVSSLAMMVTIVGIPFALQTIKLARVALMPFGTSVEKNQPATGCLNTAMNILWFFIGGIEICVSHIVLGLLFFITIIGIPFGKQHFKLAKLAIFPFGRVVK